MLSRMVPRKHDNRHAEKGGVELEVRLSWVLRPLLTVSEAQGAQPFTHNRNLQPATLRVVIDFDTYCQLAKWTESIIFATHNIRYP